MRFAAIIVLVFSTVFVGCGRYGLAYRPATDSMAPTLTRNDACTVNPFEYWDHSIERFDIVVFQSPDELKQRHGATGDVLFIKRVVGLPGEKIEIRNHDLFVNDVRVDENYQTIKDERDRKKNFGPIVVPQDEYFLMGDNRPESEDSRWYSHPTIKKQDIYSKVTKIHPGRYSSE